jgi:NTP pyrophosphatase (non-canonical NTP hydrolase)
MKGSGDFSIGSNVWPGTSKLLEEMGELQQVLGKLIATAGETKHWEGKDLKERLIEELADVQGAIRFFQIKNLSNASVEAIDKRAEEKFHLFRKWHNTPEAP